MRMLLGVASPLCGGMRVSFTQLAVASNYLCRRALCRQSSVFQEKHAVAKPLDHVEGMGDYHNGATFVVEGHHPLERLFLERSISHRKDFIDEQNVGVTSVAMANPSRVNIPLEYCLIGVSMNSSSSAKATISS